MKSVQLLKPLKEKILIFDGAMGTMLQQNGLTSQDCPEQLNYLRPDLITKIHESYIKAGADFIQSNTFGANRVKLGEFGLADEVQRINAAGIQLVKKAAQNCGKGIFVVGNIGPLGKLIYPIGEIDFDEAYDIFFEQAQALAAAGADLIAVETMSDLQEIRIAVIAAREATGLPIIAQMTFQEDQRTLTGTDPETAATVLESLGTEIIGVNCGSGAENILPVVERMSQVTNAFIIAQPNAGLPLLINGQTVFKQNAVDMSSYVPKLVEAGANIIGGCCGTTPEHIQKLSLAAKNLKPKSKSQINFSKLASRSMTVFIGSDYPTACIGERINPTARKKLAESIKQLDMQMVCREAREQFEAGAPILDVNIGVPDIDEPTAMAKAVLEIQRTVDVPLAIDSNNAWAIEAALKNFAGKALINSCNGRRESMENIFPLAKKYGAAILGLTLDDKGIPDTASARLNIARRIVNTALKYGIAKENIFIDCLVLTAGAQQQAVMETIKALKMVKEELGVKTMLGVSNVSHGMPNRELINATFLAMALGNGLDLPIINPHSDNMMNTLKAADLLTNRDKNGSYFINYTPRFNKTNNSTNTALPRTGKKDNSINHPLYDSILDGEKEHIVEHINHSLSEGIKPMDIMNKYLIPALEEAGRKYETKEFFLPQLMMAAESMKKAFQRLKNEITVQEDASKNTIVIATVKGDIHDIGKNIVALMLENHGFNVIDLGKDVPAETIVSAAVHHNAQIIALSALMTTTMAEMKNVCQAVKTMEINIDLMVGGAVVTKAYAQEIGAHFARDAVSAVALAKQLCGKHL